MTSRRQFLKAAALVGASVFIPARLSEAQRVKAKVPVVVRTRRLGKVEPTLDPTSIPKYTQPLVIPPAMPRTKKLSGPKPIDYYEIAVRQFSQQILPPGLPATTVWGYGSVNHPTSFHYPSFSIEAKYHSPVRVKWMNQLVDKDGKYLPHLLAVDPTLHWANPSGGTSGRDTVPVFTKTPGPYTGPVPIVTHVHGAHVSQEFDGYPEAWFLPAAKNIPAGYARRGTYYDKYKPAAEKKLNQSWSTGSAVFQYNNDQRATTLWYHDHTLGMTRLNVYAGPAGFYLLRGGPADIAPALLPGPAPALGDRAGKKYYEIPLGIQDRSFNSDGSLFFPQGRDFFDEFAGPYIPEQGSDIPPIWNPEFFGNAMVVNGRTWPELKVEPRRYRFRMLNGCNARFLMLKMVNTIHPDGYPDPTAPAALPFWQIGTEGGFLPAPVKLDRMLLALAERADVIVDFSKFKPGDEIYLVNLGPDEPFSGGEPGEDFERPNPITTGQVMKFTVVKLASQDTSLPPEKLKLPAIARLVPTAKIQVSLNEMMSMTIPDAGPASAALGTFDPASGMPAHKMFSEPVTEKPGKGVAATWEIYNFTADAHPIHIHQTMFQVVNRQALAVDKEGVAVQPAKIVGDPRPSEAWETGFKDTVIAYPGEVTRINARFDIAGVFVWHCHIIDHEDNEMMRPLQVV